MSAERITATINKINFIIQSQQFAKEAEPFFRIGIESLANLKLSTKMTTANWQQKYEIIVVGMVLCALTHSITVASLKENSLDDIIKSHDLKQEYPFSSFDLRRLSKITPFELKEDDGRRKMILNIGEKAITEKRLPFKVFTDNSELGKIISEAIPRDRLVNYTETWRKQELYERVYKDQQFRNRVNSYLIKGMSVAAGIIPPLSLIFTIPDAIQKRRSKYPPPFWQAFLACFVSALVPIASGVVTWILLSITEKLRQEKDPIWRYSSPLAFSEYLSANKKTNQQFREKQPKVTPELWKDNKILNKPKRVIVPYENKKGESRLYIYEDQFQKDRRSIKEHGDVRFVPQFFRHNQLESVDLVKKLEAKYGLRR